MTFESPSFLDVMKKQLHRIISIFKDGTYWHYEALIQIHSFVWGIFRAIKVENTEILK